MCVCMCLRLNRVCFQLTKDLPVDKFHMPRHKLSSNKICLELVKLIGLHPKLETNHVMHSIINLPQWRFLSITREKKGECVSEKTWWCGSGGTEQKHIIVVV